MPGGYGEGMPGTPGAPGGLQAAKVKYKLVRFFDLTAEPAKPYKYRVQLILEDPNRPQDPKADPNKRILDPAVVQRLAKVEADDKVYEKEKGKPRRTYFVTTEWSDPSNVVKVESPERVVAGGARASKVISLGPQGPDVPQTEAAGKLVSVVWDGRRATEVPVERDVVLGSVLNFAANADVLQPLTFAIKTLESHSFRTESFVVDLRGGEEIFKDKDRTHVLHSPGEFLVVNRKGELVVRNEIDDAEEYRRLLFIEDKPGGAASGSTASPYPTMDYMMPGGSPSGDYFGPSP
jgi:hypothetical protein